MTCKNLDFVHERFAKIIHNIVIYLILVLPRVTGPLVHHTPQSSIKNMESSVINNLANRRRNKLTKKKKIRKKGA